MARSYRKPVRGLNVTRHLLPDHQCLDQLDTFFWWGWSSDLWPRGEISCRPSRTTDAYRQILWRMTMSEWCQWLRCLYSSSPCQPWWVRLLCTSTHHLSLSPLLVELWKIAEWLRDWWPWPWVLHHWSVSTNIHRPVTGEFSVLQLQHHCLFKQLLVTFSLFDL